MDFTLSEEQEIFRESITRFLADEYAFDKRQKIVAADPGFHEAHWQSFAELGWLAAALPEAYGGLDGSPLETMVVMEQFGRGLLMTPYFATVVLGASLLVKGGSESQKEAILPAVAEGRLKLAFGHSESGGRFDLNDVATTAKMQGGGSYVLNGKKSVVLYGSAAHKIIVSARTGGERRDAEGISLFLVDKDAPGLTMIDFQTQDGGRASELLLEAVEVAAADLVGAEGAALPLIEEVADIGIAALVAEASGIMWTVYEQTLAYLKTRRQFGQALGAFQALQHRMVDVYMACQLAQSLVYEATAALGEGDAAKRARAASAAKHRLGLHARDVAQEGIQLHGGIGMTMDLPIGHYLKRVTAINATLGDPAYHLKRYRRLSAAP
ncbi:MAG: acyl-CoA dehydrogenase family protein [Kiloniellales bacterium]|nr:acyl-CoA dehydrogenase family protein [Kiloniellales bacterium]